MDTDVAPAQVDSDYKEVDEFSFDHAREKVIAKLIATDRKHFPDDLPSAKAKELLSIWQAEEDGEKDAFDWREEYDRQIASLPQVNEPMNDAEILGEDHPDLEAFLQKPMVFMTGDMFGQNDRRNTRPGKWKRVEMPVINWMIGGKLKDGTEWGLTRHPENEEKGGASIVPSDNFDGERTAEATKTMYAIGIDIDTGTQLEAVKAKLLEAGIFAIIYTTHSHLKDRMLLKSDVVQKALKIKETPTKAQVQEYLTDHHKDRHPKDFVAGIEIIDAKKHTKNGLFIEVKTPPVEKFRAIIPLAEPVELSDLADSFTEWKNVWADAVAGVCVNMLGAQFDTASCDINRLFYSPRHAPGAEHYSAVILGKPLHFDDIKPYSKEKYVRERKASVDPFLAGDDDKKEVGRYVTPSGRSLNEWHKKAKARFEIADILETYAADKIRHAGGERQGAVHIECPFEHEHTTPGGTACMAMNPDANKEEVWTIFCHHDSCQGRHKLEFLQEMLQQQWFPEEVLFDEGYMIPLPDQDRDDYFEAQRAGPITDLSSEGIQAALADASISKASSTGDVETFMRRCFDGGANKKDPMAVNRVNDALVPATGLTKRDYLNPIWKRFEGEAKALAEQEQSASAGTATKVTDAPDIGTSDDPAMVEYAEKRLNAASDHGNPVVYQYQGDVAVVRDGQRVMLTNDQFAAIVNDHAEFSKKMISGEHVSQKKVFAPDKVVKHMFNRGEKPYPVLNHVKRSPYFLFDGTLIVDHGYNEKAEAFLDLGGCDIPPVPPKPSGNDVFKAKRLLAEPFADFPYDGVTNRGERMRRALFNQEGTDPLPSAAHTTTMILERFVRSMIDGVTPAYGIAKNCPGTGGGLLAEIVTIIATGEEEPMEDIPTTDEEFTKVKGAMVNEGPEFCIFDNPNDAIDSGPLASLLTATKIRARLLGTPRYVTAPIFHTTVVIANHLKGTKEILRRVVMIELNARDAEPESRTGWRHKFVKAWVREHRAELVWACLVLVQNWIAKGMKPWEGDAKGSYEAWSAVMGGILRDAEIRGFLENEKRLLSYASTEQDLSVQQFVQHLAHLDDGTLLRPGGTSEIRGRAGEPVVSIQDELNEADDGKPLRLKGYGFNREDNRYNHARDIKEKFRELARGTYQVTLSERDPNNRQKTVDALYEISFEEFPDPKSQTAFYWVLCKKRVPA